MHRPRQHAAVLLIGLVGYILPAQRVAAFSFESNLSWVTVYLGLCRIERVIDAARLFEHDVVHKHVSLWSIKIVQHNPRSPRSAVVKHPYCAHVVLLHRTLRGHAHVRRIDVSPCLRTVLSEREIDGGGSLGAPWRFVRLR